MPRDLSQGFIQWEGEASPPPQKKILDETMSLYTFVLKTSVGIYHNSVPTKARCPHF